MKLLQVYDQDGVKLGLVDMSECGVDDKDVAEVLRVAFNESDAILRDGILLEAGIEQVYINDSEHIHLD